MTTDRGAAIFPWRSANDAIGGIIVMLTVPEQQHADDVTISEIANLFGHFSSKVKARPAARARIGEKW